MEKARKNRKKSKRLRRRIGLVAIGGMSLMLTVCLSVGATLAWFAGSTWASNDMYMGGPVYVEMAGRGHSGTTAGTEENAAVWQGGNGTLDIMASSRSTGTASSASADQQKNILLPGQKLLIYSQARVFSTAYSSSVGTTDIDNESSGANTTNSSSENGQAKYNTGTGKIVSTTTSVLRARFTINVEFDPYMGFNNFTDEDYAAYYPVQSENYKGEFGAPLTGTRDYAVYDDQTTGDKFVTWESAAGASSIGVANGRRDAVTNEEVDDGQNYWINTLPTSMSANELAWIKAGTSKAVYEWKYVSLKEYKDAAYTDLAALKAAKGDTGSGYVRMGAPFDGTKNSAGGDSNRLGANGNFEVNTGGSGNGYYGVWVVKGGKYQESAAFYKARTEAYMKSYKEHYKDDYNRNLILTISNSLNSLENALNTAFEKLVNESSDNILAGKTGGFTVDEATGKLTQQAATAHKASWLYVDPKYGNDTNAGDSTTQRGGWWYLVRMSDDTTAVSTGNPKYVTEVDAITKDGSAYTGALSAVTTADYEKMGHSKTTVDAGVLKTALAEAAVKDAKLYEITPNLAKDGAVVTTDGGIYKVVSDAFPFVNGDFELPGRELTNVFANAKITFQISFQALQAFFPFTPSIDGIASGTSITGTGKALNIGNAIPIFNEAFDYLTVLD